MYIYRISYNTIDMSQIFKVCTIHVKTPCGYCNEGRVADHLWLGGNPYGWGVMILMVGG